MRYITKQCSGRIGVTTMFNEKQELNEIIKQLQTLEKLQDVNGISNTKLEIHIDAKRNELYINGNHRGLLYFARRILGIVSADYNGSHAHFDSNNVVYPCEIALIVGLKLVEGDET
jgi:hypothetical protein